jgi:hypothetical protein
MLPRKARKTAPAVTRRSPQSSSATGERRRTLTLRSPKTQPAIHAELAGAHCCSARGITAHSTSPVLVLCRLLVEAGRGPRRPLRAYRGDVLCLRVRSIRESARVEVNGHGTGFIKQAWLVLARRHGCLHGDSAAAFNDARWLAHNLGLPICVRVQS